MAAILYEFPFLRLAPHALSAKLLFPQPVVMGCLVEGLRRLLAVTAAGGVGFQAPREVFILIARLAVPPVLLAFSTPGLLFLRFLTFSRPPTAFSWETAFSPIMVISICLFSMWSFELPWKISIFLDIFQFPFYSPIPLLDVVFVVIAIYEWRCWKRLVKHPSLCTFMSIMAFLCTVVAIHQRWLSRRGLWLFRWSRFGLWSQYRR